MSNLSLYQPRKGPDDSHIGDGSGLTHNVNISLSPSFSLSNILCVLSIKKDLIYVFKLCHSNHTSLELFPSYFVIKDLRKESHVLHGKNRHVLSIKALSWNCPLVWLIKHFHKFILVFWSSLP